MKCPNCGTKITLEEMAAELGKKGGNVDSEARRIAARENGKKGGRPRKNAQA